MSDVRRQFRSSLPVEIEALEQARASLDVAGDTSVSALREIAHKLHGTGATLGYPEVSVAAAAVQQAVDDELADAVEVLIRVLRHVSGPPDETRATDADADRADPLPSAAILLAEDDAVIATLIQFRLRRAGLDVVHHRDGLKALDAAGERRFALCILDVKMPGMDGYDLLRALRGLEGYRRVPILMLTALGKEEDIVRGFKLGASDYMTKPFSPVELMARVTRLLVEHQDSTT